ncbi:MAG: DNA-processing protein DprA [Butyricicoccus sp.]|nr:DNA-processing protein DprA [Butyricicoccus sp.]
MSELIYWVWFSSLRGVRTVLLRELLRRLGGPKAVFLAEERALTECGASAGELDTLLNQRQLKTAGEIISRCEQQGTDILTLQDAAYPARLRAIPDPPWVLYVRGRLPDVDSEAAIAIVGTRRSSPYGDKMARELGYGVSKGGGLVISGLAEGIDSCAAQGALMAGGRVIGVLGTAIDEVYPRFNRALFDDVAATGALVSEYPPGTEGNRRFFPARNRIMAGLAVGVVVVEAPVRSGALISAGRAADYGRDVFAVPGNADAANSHGTNALIRDGARLVENAGQILEEYENRFRDKLKPDGKLGVPPGLAEPKPPHEEKTQVQKPDKREDGEGFFKLRVPTRRKKAESAPPKLAEQLEGLSENQLKIVSVMKKPSMHIDDIIDLTQLPASAVLAELTLLQIKGFVAQEGGKRFTLKIAKRG